MSQSGKVRPKKRRLWRIAAWVFLLLAVVVLITAAYIWKNRYDLLEGQARKRLMQMGIGAELEIDHLDKYGARLKDIRLSKNGEEFFKASGINLQYELKDALEGTFKRVVIIEPHVNLTLDKQGQIIDDWLPASSENDNKFEIPEDGFAIEDAHIIWQAPFGQGDALVSADIKSPEAWSVMIDAKDTVFRQDGVSVKLSFQGVVEQQNPEKFNAFGSLTTKILDTPALQTGPLKADFNLFFSRGMDTEKMDIQGWANLVGADVESADFSMKDAELRLDLSGVFSMQTRWLETLRSDWKIVGDKVSVRNQDLRSRWSNMLTSHETLSNAPIAQHYTGFLRQKAGRLMQEFDMTGQGRYQYTPAGYTIGLDVPLVMKAKGQGLHIKPRQGLEFLSYDKVQAQLIMQGDMAWTGPRRIDISGLEFVANSLDGRSIDSLASVKARLKSAAPWEMNKHGQDFRLAPFEVKFDYQKDLDDRHINLVGALDYDGLVPGGRVQGLRADGVMNIDMAGQAMRLGYKPKGPVQIGVYTSASGWRAENLSFDISGADKFMRRTAGGQPMEIALHNVKTNIISPEDDKHLNSSFDTVYIKTDFSGFPQKWDMEITGTDITSDDFPSPGTHIVSKAGALSLLQSENGDLEFAAVSPDTFVETDNVSAQNMQINIAGRPNDFLATYDINKVAFKAGDLPIIPMQGTARLRDGLLTGQAVATLPAADNAPINIDFRSEGGFGSAHIVIPKIIFDPRGLQPQYLVPTLTGKLADVRGEVSAQVNVSFGGDVPIRSSGSTQLKDLDVGTLVGPFTGVNADLKFSSMFPLKSEGVQTATLSGFDPGFPLENGIIKFKIVPGGVRIDQALWPIPNNIGQDGKIFITPVDWRFGNVKNRAIVNIEDVDLGTMLAGIGKDKFTATGRVSGALPAVIDGVNVLIEDGVLAVKGGGIIKYKNPATDAAAQHNENAGYAFKALENFEYKELEARIDGPLDGEMMLKIVFEGKNPEVLSAQPFLFNTEIRGELANIARNMANAFSTEENLERVLQIRKNEEAKD